MRATFLAALLGTALFTIPAPANQPNDVRLSSLKPEVRLTSMQLAMGFALDPHQSADFEITLPDAAGDVVVDAGPMAMVFLPN